MGEKALLVCFGGMSNVGTLTGLAALELTRAGEATIFCLASLANGDPVVRKRLEEAEMAVLFLAPKGLPSAPASLPTALSSFPKILV